MAKRRAQRRDPMHDIIEEALQPGNSIAWNEGASFVSDLGEVERQIEQLSRSDPARAVELYETFIAGCTEKAEEVDDSDGELGAFAGGLFLGWIKARQAAGADRDETAGLLLKWMDDDPYGFCNDLGRQAATVLDRSGLAALEREVRPRFEAAALSAGSRKQDPRLDFAIGHWGGMLNSVYRQQRAIQKYIDVTVATGLTQADCEAIATMFQAKRRLNDALAWVERGLKVEKPGAFGGSAGYNLVEMRRALLVKLGRGSEALDSAWAEFQAHPSKFTYEDLLRYVPKAEREEWHGKAMAAAEEGDLASLIELWLSVKEIGRLAERLERVTNTRLESLSHYVAEPAADRLARTHPAVAARVFRALCVRILKAGKSKYYSAALSNLGRARDCYKKAGLEAEWQVLAAEIRREHHRKSSFVPGFDRIVAGISSRREASFLDRARRRWVRRGNS
jgi:hypothetical protein